MTLHDLASIPTDLVSHDAIDRIDCPSFQTMSKLSDYGYANVSSLTRDQRHDVLRVAIAVLGESSVILKLANLSMFNRNKNPELAAMFKRDKEFVQAIRRERKNVSAQTV